MARQKHKQCVFVALPTNGVFVAEALFGLQQATRRDKGAHFAYDRISLTTYAFNKLWAEGLNHREKFGLSHFAMHHSDIGAGMFWVDTLVDECNAHDADIVAAVVPLKDHRGLTSTAIWEPGGRFWRLTMEEIFQLPETFCIEDVQRTMAVPNGSRLLVNTGLWICRFTEPWVEEVCFDLKEGIVKKPDGRYQAGCLSEDWLFSHWANERNLRIFATRKVPLLHVGSQGFTNEKVWGSWKHDQSDDNYVPIEGFRLGKNGEPDSGMNGKVNGHTKVIKPGEQWPAACYCPEFPNVRGWMIPKEGEFLAEIARGKRVLEIGSYCGLSTLYLSKYAEQVVSVDTHDGRGTPEERDTFTEFLANMRRFGRKNVQAVCEYSVHLFKKRPDLEGTFDLVFIDGSHDADSVRADTEIAMRALRPGGKLAFHDYEKPGVAEVIDELKCAGTLVIGQAGAVLYAAPGAMTGGLHKNESVFSTV